MELSLEIRICFARVPTARRLRVIHILRYPKKNPTLQTISPLVEENKQTAPCESGLFKANKNNFDHRETGKLLAEPAD